MFVDEVAVVVGVALVHQLVVVLIFNQNVDKGDFVLPGQPLLFLQSRTDIF